MKNIMYFLGSLLLALAAAFFANKWLGGFENPGYVLIGIGHWSLETSLIVFTVSLIISFFLFYAFFRLLGWLIRLPGQVKNRGKNINFNRSQEALIAGLVDSAEGNWERAEKVLIKHASHSGAPLIHYLTAARAAQSRGAFDKRDEYLKTAADQAPGSDVAIGLTQAELHLSEKQFEQALATLTRLHSIDPNHASVLKLLHQAYQQANDWEGIRKLLPSLNTHKVLMEAEIKLLETEAFSNLLKQAAERGSADEIEGLWAEMPPYIKSMKGVSAIYFAAMIDAGVGAKVEADLAQTLSVAWNQTLVVLFGNVQAADAAKQLETAEQWLSKHPRDAVLLTVLGKLSLNCADAQKAEGYLSKSISIEPTVRAYQLLGDLLVSQGDTHNACELYKLALELASSEIVSRIDAISE
ncbi:MAG: heme biosynthesis HemY N-terminal domain-containing protein [Methylobacter sp.]|nr:heme biosynthesis HemY N-terminal domain-containing protein [Methylobacter sp.]MDP2097801.1 heme biosynthesis HemY N-terminal domain-containing protein [Methylobacter sp.]MDP2429071.1 heme biosynthesis HemY N-terminal domain-containing protein [Methylobacter sp.]MDP3054496.1 heme biosynthesis HemY N-terminal domain-containing protein [Methylobacter sp.]MDP3362383.1 heme biosynthesis HemY N-terminal domain-containing protein [Methylobacter sp.]